MDCLTPAMTECCYNVCWCCHSTAHGFTDPGNPYLHFQWGCLHPPWRDLANNTKVEFHRRSGDVPPGGDLDIPKLRASSAHSGRSCIPLIGCKHWRYIDRPASPKECWTNSGKSTLTDTTRPARGIATVQRAKVSVTELSKDSDHVWLKDKIIDVNYLLLERHSSYEEVTREIHSNLLISSCRCARQTAHAEIVEFLQSDVEMEGPLQ